MNEYAIVGRHHCDIRLEGNHSTMISDGTWTSFFVRYLKSSLGLRRGVGFGSKSIASLERQLGLLLLSSVYPWVIGDGDIFFLHYFFRLKTDADQDCRSEEEKEKEKTKGLRFVKNPKSNFPKFKAIATSSQ